MTIYLFIYNFAIKKNEKYYKPNSFKILLAESKKEVFLAAYSRSDYETWISAIEKANVSFFFKLK